MNEADDIAFSIRPNSLHLITESITSFFCQLFILLLFLSLLHAVGIMHYLGLKKALFRGWWATALLRMTV